MPTNVYIDGFNLYYGAVKRTGYKWLDLGALCSTLLPGRTINKIRYFTALAKGLPHNPDVRTRQQIYLRALRTIPGLTIHRGEFKMRQVSYPRFPLVYPQNSGPANQPPLMVTVQRSEEKGTDVNLATFLLVDCFDNDFDEAVIFTNDSDLAAPIKVVTGTFHKQVTVVNPQRRALRMVRELSSVASATIASINASVLRSSQFPLSITDAKGTFSKPPTW